MLRAVSEHPESTPGGSASVSGNSVLAVGLALVLIIAGTAWLLRPQPPSSRDVRRRSPTLTVGTSGGAPTPQELETQAGATPRTPPTEAKPAAPSAP